jgi:hypothetical protein
MNNNWFSKLVRGEKREREKKGGQEMKKKGKKRRKMELKKGRYELNGERTSSYCV